MPILLLVYHQHLVLLDEMIPVYDKGIEAEFINRHLLGGLLKILSLRHLEVSRGWRWIEQVLIAVLKFFFFFKQEALNKYVSVISFNSLSLFMATD